MNEFTEDMKKKLFKSLGDETAEEFGLRTECKQIIAIRRDLKMSPGKLGAQCAHASIAFISNSFRDAIQNAKDGTLTGWFSPPEHSWLQGRFTKIVVFVDSEEELMKLHEDALEAGLNAHLIRDAGLSEFGEPTNTCVGIGPDWVENLDPITGHLPTR